MIDALPGIIGLILFFIITFLYGWHRWQKHQKWLDKHVVSAERYNEIKRGY